MKMAGLTVLVALLGMGLNAYAIDRDARMIDTVSLNVASLNDADSIGGSLWGETAFNLPRQDWALLIGGGYDEISPDDDSSNLAGWTMGIGLKYYLLPVTSFSAVGTYSRYDADNGAAEDKDIKAATLTAKQRFMPASDPFCPYAKGSLTWRNRSTFSGFDPAVEDDSFSEYLLTVAGGIEFEMRPDFTIIFEAGYVTADASDNDAEDLDGFIGSVAMQYYWK